MAVGVALPPSPLRLRSRTLFPSISIKVASTGDSHSIPKVVVTGEHVKNGKLINALAKHAIHCLEMPLIQHDDGPDLPKLPSVLAGKAIGKMNFSRSAGSPSVRIGIVGNRTTSIMKEAVNSSQAIEVAFSPSKAQWFLVHEPDVGDDWMSSMLLLMSSLFSVHHPAAHVPTPTDYAPTPTAAPAPTPFPLIPAGLNQPSLAPFRLPQVQSNNSLQEAMAMMGAYKKQLKAYEETLRRREMQINAQSSQPPGMSTDKYFISVFVELDIGTRLPRGGNSSQGASGI